MINYINPNDIAQVADTIRAKAGTTSTLVWPDGFISAISDINTYSYVNPGTSGTPTEPGQQNTIDIANCDIIMTPTTIVWDGNEHIPIITVKYNNTELVENTDYTISNLTPQTEVNDYQYTITGQGTYSNSITQTWSIEKATGKITNSVPILNPDVNSQGTALQYNQETTLSTNIFLKAENASTEISDINDISIEFVEWPKYGSGTPLRRDITKTIISRTTSQVRIQYSEKITIPTGYTNIDSSNIFVLSYTISTSHYSGRIQRSYALVI